MTKRRDQIASTRPQRRLRVIEFDGDYFGEDIVTLRWIAEDGTAAQRIFEPSVWDTMPDWAERRYEAAVTAHPVTHFDVVRVFSGHSPVDDHENICADPGSRPSDAPRPREMGGPAGSDEDAHG